LRSAAQFLHHDQWRQSHHALGAGRRPVVRLLRRDIGSQALGALEQRRLPLAGDLWLCLTLDERTRSSPLPEYSHIAFSVSGSQFVDAAARIRAAGATIWRDNRSEGASLYFLDPDGHKLEIHSGDWRTRLAAMKEHPWDANIQYFE
jgi:catechol 2,3-dioxygenase-like lactoylglutathione lyase family enzyme